MPKITYTLPNLPYAYNDLEPYYDAKTVEIHYSRHHAAYVAGANAAQEKLEKMRETGDFSTFKSISKELAFHVSGHQLHSLFWKNLAPAEKTGEISSSLIQKIEEDFGSFEIFKKEFTAAGIQVEGSGWVVFSLRKSDNVLVITQIEKHQDLLQSQLIPLLVCDEWEHAYYLKYQNKRPEWMEAFWNIVNWNEVSNRFQES